MTEDPDGLDEDIDEARRLLAARLRELRRAADLSGEQLAARCRWSQSKVSKIETGKTVPQVADVNAWASAIDATADVRAELEALTEDTLTAVEGWRKALRGGRGRMQARIAKVEAASSVVRTFQPLIVPGLLQTAEYARRLFGFAQPPLGADDLAAALNARMERQAVLFDLRKRFEFVIGEPGLRWRIAPAHVMRGQLDRIGSLIGLPNVDIGVIPTDAAADVLLYHGFVIFGEPGHDDDVHVSVETITEDLTVRDADKVATYLDELTRLRGAAVFGDQARAALTAVADDLPPGT
ncbi:MAG: helix-turn-helix domain-containing protein [Egibacteraceae bacterium]